jgi:hypothetical protein
MENGGVHEAQPVKDVRRQRGHGCRSPQEHLQAKDELLMPGVTVPPPGHPWRNKEYGFSHRRKPTLTLTEVNAIKQAWATGEFRKARLARIYDVTFNIITRVIDGQYSHFREI